MSTSKLTFEARLAELLGEPFDSEPGAAPFDERLLARVRALLADRERLEVVKTIFRDRGWAPLVYRVAGGPAGYIWTKCSVCVSIINAIQAKNEWDRNV